MLAVAGWLRFLRDYGDAGDETPVVGRHMPPAAFGRHEALRTRCRCGGERHVTLSSPGGRCRPLPAPESNRLVEGMP